MQYWYNVSTRQVEEHTDARSRSADLMGPYATVEEAESALLTAQARTSAWDEEDRRRAEAEGEDPDGANWDVNPFNDND